jgi:hypothetical protein
MPVSLRRRSFHWTGAILVAFAALTLFLGVSRPAFASDLPAKPSGKQATQDRVTWTNTGSTGGVGLPATIGLRSFGYGGQVYLPERRVCTTRAYSGYQTITLTLRNYKWLSGRWQLYGYHPYNFQWKPTVTATYRVAPGTCVNATWVLWQVISTPGDLVGGSTGGYFSTDLTVRWNKASNGVFLGRQYIDYNGRDYQCFSEYAPACTAGNGWVYMEGFPR